MVCIASPETHVCRASNHAPRLGSLFVATLGAGLLAALRPLHHSIPDQAGGACPLFTLRHRVRRVHGKGTAVALKPARRTGFGSRLAGPGAYANVVYLAGQRERQVSNKAIQSGEGAQSTNWDSRVTPSSRRLFHEVSHGLAIPEAAPRSSPDSTGKGRRDASACSCSAAMPRSTKQHSRITWHSRRKTFQYPVVDPPL